MRPSLNLVIVVIHDVMGIKFNMQSSCVATNPQMGLFLRADRHTDERTDLKEILSHFGEITAGLEWVLEVGGACKSRGCGDPISRSVCGMRRGMP